jgi:hypothetical protein
LYHPCRHPNCFLQSHQFCGWRRSNPPWRSSINYYHHHPIVHVQHSNCSSSHDYNHQQWNLCRHPNLPSHYP